MSSCSQLIKSTLEVRKAVVEAPKGLGSFILPPPLTAPFGLAAEADTHIVYHTFWLDIWLIS